jgi:hypothetical protein
MSDFQIFIKYNGQKIVFWTNHKMRINILLRNICNKFKLPYYIEYDLLDPSKISIVKTPFYLLCNSKILDRCGFKTINQFNSKWPKYEISKETVIDMYRIYVSK